MDPRKISSFASLLRDNGDKILNSGYKLTLSGSLLRALNDSFVLIVDENECSSRTFQVVKNNNSKSNAILDLQFIHDFVQKTFYLSLTNFQNDDQFDGIADISKFRNLQTLEIQRIPISQIIGIKQIRAQLQEIICVRKCIKSVKDIISDCGGDISNGFVWNELKSADFSSNCLISIDDSLEFTPWLQNLNLSHNQIVSVDAIKWLPHLKVLDLSYNKLSHIPSFNLEASRRLKILILSNNFIECLSGISRLDALNELDLSGNCLLDHSYILPLSSLSALNHLNLQENPLSCVPKHREATAKYLHKNTSLQKFLLDFEPLSKYEKSLTGNIKSHFSIFASRNSLHSHSSGQRTPNTRNQDSNTPYGSFSSVNTLMDEASKENLYDSVTSLQQKKIKVRKAKIAEFGDNEKKLKEEPKKIVPKIDEGNKEHLETKKEIENLRKQFGDSWLLSQSGNNKSGNNSAKEINITSEDIRENLLNFDVDDDKLGLEIINKTEQKLNISDKITIDTNKLKNNDLMTSTPVNDRVNFLNEFESPIKITSPTKSTDTEYKSANDNDDTNEKFDSIYKSIEESFESNDGNDGNQSAIQEVSDTEENEISYIVKVEPIKEEIYLILSDVSIREKDIITGITKTKWTLNMLESCERRKSNIITINFDTIKKDKKTRTYILERSSCHKMEKYLRDILSKRPLSEMNQTLFRCAKCTTQFSRENLNNKPNIDIICPECFSTYVIEIKDTTTIITGKEEENNQPDKSSNNELLLPGKLNSIKKSTSHSSIAPISTDAWRQTTYKNKLRSAGSLNESSSCSKISNSESSFDSNQSVAGSSNNERDRDQDMLSSKNGMESDIEILSNPSQSSIEVLDRKQSEERKISQIPTLDTIIDDSNINNYKLTDQYTSTHHDIISDNSNKTDIKLIDEIDTIKNVNLTLQSTNNNNNNKQQQQQQHLGVINLTESSSSGSITDSICTAYEQTHGVPKLDEKLNENKIQTISEKPIKNDSVLSSMLGGLFQSTNTLMSKSQTKNNKSNDMLNDLTFEPFKYSYNDFSHVDHRLKLYLYQNIFEDENEKLKWLSRGRCILDENNLDELNNGFEAIFLMSTTKFYVLKVIGLENDDDPTKWVKQNIKVTVDRVEKVRVLPWKIGLEFIIKGIGSVVFLLNDISRTENLLLYFADNSLPDTCEIDYQVSEDLSRKLLKTANDKQIKMLGILRSCEISTEQTVSLSISTILVTDTNLYIGTNFKWISSRSNYDYDIYIQQQMNNLVEFERIDDEKFILTFLDENEDKCELWKFVFETQTSADFCLNVISQFWEKIFGVPLAYT